MKLSLTILISLLLASSANAQSGSGSFKRMQKDLEKAERLFSFGHYEQAIRFYGFALQRQYDPDVCARMAQCHANRGEYLDAEYWYGQAVESDGLDPVHFRAYAEVLRANGKVEKARVWFENYDRYALYPETWKPGYELVAELSKSPESYRIAAVDLNSAQSEITPGFYGDAVVFATDRPGQGWSTSSASSGRGYYDLYLSYSDDGQRFDPPALLKGGVNSPWHDAGFAMDPSTGTVWFTRSSSRGWKRVKDGKGTVRPTIYRARLRGNRIGRARPFEALGRNHSAAHPSLSEDGNRLYFSADREGGQGGMDIWYVDRLSSGWAEPVNMGPDINTAGNELFPFIAGEEKLYFSSDGHPGVGGLDVFSASLQNGGWGEVSNLGLVINSPRDDFGLIIRNNQGYFCSDRAGGMGGDDIYAFERLFVPVKVEVLHKQTGQPLSQVTVEWIPAGEGPFEHIELQTNSRGEVTAQLKPGQSFYLLASKSGFQQAVLSDTRNRERFTVLLEPNSVPDNNPARDRQDESGREVEPDDPDSESQYFIQLGRFRSPDMVKLSELEVIGKLVEEERDGLTVVYLGAWPSREAALTALGRVHAAGYRDAFVLKRGKEQVHEP